jgi:type I restriction enzyme R subunit
MEASSNFAFLTKSSPALARLGALAERYFTSDAPAALIKLRQLAEFIAKDVAARHGLLPKVEVTFDEALRALRTRSLLPREIGEMFFHLKKVGNQAGDALTALKIARAVAVWFHQSYQGAPGYKAGPFVPPAPPWDAGEALHAQIAELRAAVKASADNEAKARLAKQEAETARLNAIAESEAKIAALETERQFWEAYAAEAESQGARKAAKAELKGAQAVAQEMVPAQLDLLAQVAAAQAARVELDEATTRVLIDEQLRASAGRSTAPSCAMLQAFGPNPVGPSRSPNGPPQAVRSTMHFLWTASVSR